MCSMERGRRILKRLFRWRRIGMTLINFLRLKAIKLILRMCWIYRQLWASSSSTYWYSLWRLLIVKRLKPMRRSKALKNGFKTFWNKFKSSATGSWTLTRLTIWIVQTLIMCSWWIPLTRRNLRISRIKFYKILNLVQELHKICRKIIVFCKIWELLNFCKMRFLMRRSVLVAISLCFRPLVIINGRSSSLYLLPIEDWVMLDISKNQ